MRILIILFLLTIGVVQAQNPIVKFLESSISDQEIQDIETIQTYLSESNFNSPFLRDVDFRVRTGSGFSVDEYRMRIGLLNPMEMRANKQYQTVLDKTLSLRKQVKYAEILQQRMGLIIENLRLRMSLELTDSLLAYFDQLKEVYVQNTSENDYEELIKLESDLFDQTLIRKNLIYRQATNAYLIKERYQGYNSLEIDSALIVSIPMIRNDVLLKGENNRVALLDQELMLEDALFKIEKAEAWSNLGFIQAEYDIDRGNSINEHLGYQIGVTLPLFNSKRPDLKREEADLLEEIADSRLEKNEIDREYDMSMLRLTFMLDNWDLSTAHLSKLQEWEQLNITSIKALIELKKKQFDINQWRVQSMTNILLLYIDLKFKTSTEANHPNYLSKEQEVLQISLD